MTLGGSRLRWILVDESTVTLENITALEQGSRLNGYPGWRPADRCSGLRHAVCMCIVFAPMFSLARGAIVRRWRKPHLCPRRVFLCPAPGPALAQVPGAGAASGSRHWQVPAAHREIR